MDEKITLSLTRKELFDLVLFCQAYKMGYVASESEKVLIEKVNYIAKVWIDESHPGATNWELCLAADAEHVISETLLSNNELLVRAIDQALDRRDEETFKRLSAEYRKQGLV
jgi:hypothetical protein